MLHFKRFASGLRFGRKLFAASLAVWAILIAQQFVNACIVQCRQAYCWGDGSGSDCSTYEPWQAFNNYYATQSDGQNYTETKNTADYYDSYTCTGVCGGNPGDGFYQEMGACGLDASAGMFTQYTCKPGS